MFSLPRVGLVKLLRVGELIIEDIQLFLDLSGPFGDVLGLNFGEYTPFIFFYSYDKFRPRPCPEVRPGLDLDQYSLGLI